jgi:hypothetical protein
MRESDPAREFATVSPSSARGTTAPCRTVTSSAPLRARLSSMTGMRAGLASTAGRSRARSARADRGDVADARAQFEHAEPFLHAAFGGVGLIGLVTAIAQLLRDQRRGHGRGRWMSMPLIFVHSPVTPCGPGFGRCPRALPRLRSGPCPRSWPHRPPARRRRSARSNTPRNPAFRKTPAQRPDHISRHEQLLGKLRVVSQSDSQKPRTVAPLKIIVPGLSDIGCSASAP